MKQNICTDDLLLEEMMNVKGGTAEDDGSIIIICTQGTSAVTCNGASAVSSQKDVEEN